MSRYLLINIGIVLFPLIFSFERQVRFYTKLRFYFYSIGTVSPIYLIWDEIATRRGDWGFSKMFTGSIMLGSLPLEEVLFFITVPYAVLFIYESVAVYIKEKEYQRQQWVLYFSLLLLAAGVYYNEQHYTATVLIFSGILLLIGYLLPHGVLFTKRFLITMALSYIPFLIVNYLLTAPPIVWYSDKAIWGPRFITIPLEDFFYSFSMNGFWLYFYTLYKKKSES